MTRRLPTSRITPHHRLLKLRVLALQNVRTAYEPHQAAFRLLNDTPITKLSYDEVRINWLVRQYRRQITPELVPALALPRGQPRAFFTRSAADLAGGT